MEMVSNFNTGSEILAMSNPGDYEEEMGDATADYEIIEVDG